MAPILLPPPTGRSPSLKEGGLWGGKSKVGRMSAGNCNCEMCLQRWVASLQRLDAFATDGCTAVPRRGAHRAPVYPRCYNNPSRGRAKGHRGDRKAPISNRRQGRKALTGEAPDLPLRGRGTAAGGGRSERRSARPRGLGGDFDLPRSKVATGLLPFAWDAPPR